MHVCSNQQISQRLVSVKLGPISNVANLFLRFMMSDYPALDPEYLREVVSTLCGQDGAAPGAPFAHIQFPLYRDPEKHWMVAIGQAFQGIEGHIMFVAPDNELA